jgi:pimeloyl-ACP methyl ester carboxylesterase
MKENGVSSVLANGIQIAYEEYGNAGDPVLLMVQGLGMPLSAWPPVYLEPLVAAGFRVIIFDNRDIGRSQLLSDLKVPNMLLELLRLKLRMKVRAPYQLDDMMRDTVGLMDALQIDSAHLVGVSMGGMISQLLAIHEPTRVRSLTSIMSTTNDRKLPGPTKAVKKHIARGPRSTAPEEQLKYHWKLWRLLGSPKYPLSDEELGQFLKRVFERGVTAEGVARQALAIFAAPSRVQALQTLEIPTLIIHGDADPLIRVECGTQTARAIPDAKMVTITGMGHDLPQELAARLTGLIVEHAKRVDAGSGRKVTA